jgi:glycogen operon protein
MSVSAQQLAFCLHGSSQNDADIYAMINAGSTDVDFGIHERRNWRVAAYRQYGLGEFR